ncbi:nuclear transport factor 2 family protein [Ilumatobacter sp.]|uniref:nuclear transport factor 2 family protein n=1 Tax=Ilumatobacter sp. TaxID=1967498 RepID=UPI003C43CE1F
MHDPRIDVAETVYRFAYGIDQRDWAGYRSIFVEPPTTIDFDYSSYHGRPAAAMDVDAWVGAVTPLFSGLDATQHTMSNPVVEIDGAVARCRVYMQAAHFLWADDLVERTGDAVPEFTIGGFYDDRLVRCADDRWRIDAVRLTVWWRRGNERIMELARTRDRP